MLFKEDLEDAKERMEAWWDREIIDRPVISYYFPKKRGTRGAYIDYVGEDWSLAQTPDGIKETIDGFEKRAELTFFGGEAIPSYFPNYGPGIVEAVFGIEPKFENRTVWFNRPTKPEEIIDLLENVKLDQNNTWYSRLLRVTEYAAKRAGNNYQISLTDLGGVLDVLSSFLGPTNILLTMKRQPNKIDTCREIILEKLLNVCDTLQGIIETFCDGCNSWLNIWSRKRWYPIQCDFAAMLNPKWFKRFVLPDIISQAEHMDYGIYHLDGSNQIPFLDDLLRIPQIVGIQWVPGAGKEPMGSKKWMPIYKKIQNAGKNVIIDSPVEYIPSLYKNLNPKGLFVRTFYQSEIIAGFYLPSFVGGEGGKLIFEAINWLKVQGKKKITKDELNLFLDNKCMDVNSKIKRDLFKEINSSILEKKYYM